MFLDTSSFDLGSSRILCQLLQERSGLSGGQKIGSVTTEAKQTSQRGSVQDLPFGWFFDTSGLCFFVSIFCWLLKKGMDR